MAPAQPRAQVGLVKRDWVKPGAIVIDVGINFVEDKSKKSGKRMMGDCADEARCRAEEGMRHCPITLA